MAGHIDHGKTTLTRALTNIDTDRLKEEKERKISIEPGFALLYEDENLHVSLIDVPGHERFIRQMIAGVASVDAICLVVAADEGVMPQTKEHVDILSLLGVDKGLIVFTKCDRVEEELLELAKEDVQEALQGTPFADAPSVFVDSLSGKGVDACREAMFALLADVPARTQTVGAFRMAIDQSFSMKGQGTIVRGTILEGTLAPQDTVFLLPQHERVKVRQLQVHGKSVERVFAGQRAAVNVPNVTKEATSRGHVLVEEDLDTSTILDVELTLLPNLQHPVKQRMPVTLHIGTHEQRGTLVFFDRNGWEEGQDAGICYAQLRLDGAVVAKRNDRFIIRRPSPVETIGGGFVIDPYGGRYRFGDETVSMLKTKAKGTPNERLLEQAEHRHTFSKKELVEATGVTEKEWEVAVTDGVLVSLGNDLYASDLTVRRAREFVLDWLLHFHEAHPLLQGADYAEFIQTTTRQFNVELAKAITISLQQEDKLRKEGAIVSLQTFIPHVPKQWEKRVAHVVQAIKSEGWNTSPWSQHLATQSIPAALQLELQSFLQERELLFLADDVVVHHDVVTKSIQLLQEQTGPTFTLQDAKSVLQISRKYLVPFLEKLDDLGYTARKDGERTWKVEVNL